MWWLLQLDEWDAVANAAFAAEPMAILALAILSVPVALVAISFWVFRPMVVAHNENRERQIVAAEQNVIALHAIRANGESQNSLNVQQVNLLQKIGEGMSAAQSEIEATHQDVTALRAEQKRGFADTRQALDGLPEKLSAEVRPLLSELEGIRLKIEAAKSATETNYRMLSVELVRTQTALTTRLDAIIAQTGGAAALAQSQERMKQNGSD